MRYVFCGCCDHCDPSKINDKGHGWCEKHSTYVQLDNGCDDFYNAMLESWTHLGQQEP